MKVYVVVDPNYPDPEMVYKNRADALDYVALNKHANLHVYKIKVRNKATTPGVVGGERVVTDPSSY